MSRRSRRSSGHSPPLGLRPGVVRPVYGLAESALAVTFSDEGERLVDVVDAEALEGDDHARAGHAGGADAQLRLRGTAAAHPARPDYRRGRPGARDRTVGEVVVSGPSVMHGYHNRPDESALTIKDGWLRTGDLGYFADGRLYLTGRLKDLIIRHGRNYYPPDIELVIAGTDGVIRGGSAVFSLEDAAEPWVIAVAETRVRQARSSTRSRAAFASGVHDAFLFGPDGCVSSRSAVFRAPPAAKCGGMRAASCTSAGPPGRRAPCRFIGPPGVARAQRKNSSASRSPWYHGSARSFMMLT